MASGNGNSYEASGPSAPQTARAVLAELPTQVKGFGDVPAYIRTRDYITNPNPNSGLVIQSRATGVSALTVQFATGASGSPNTPVANQALSVAVVGNAIIVSLATNAASQPESTAAQVRDAINTTAASNALVSAAVNEGDGSGIVGTFGPTGLVNNAVATVGVASNAPLPKVAPQQNVYVGRGGRA